MEFQLPNSVVALLQGEHASENPKAYFISSGKKSIKITLVYAKDHQQPQQLQHMTPSSSEESSTVTHRKKSRYSPSSKNGKAGNTILSHVQSRKQQQNMMMMLAKQQGNHGSHNHHYPHNRLQNWSSSSPKHRRSQQNILSNSNGSRSSSVQSEAEQDDATPEFNMDMNMMCSERRDDMSTVDSGHPSSSHRSSSSVTGTHHDEAASISGSEVNDEDDGSDPEQEEDSCSEDSDKPRTPGRELHALDSSFGPGETPILSRDDACWQTWTRIPRQQMPQSSQHVSSNYNPTNQTCGPPRSVSPNIKSRVRANGHLTMKSGDRVMPVPTQRRSRVKDPPKWDSQVNS